MTEPTLDHRISDSRWLFVVTVVLAAAMILATIGFRLARPAEVTVQPRCTPIPVAHQRDFVADVALQGVVRYGPARWIGHGTGPALWLLVGNPKQPSLLSTTAEVVPLNDEARKASIQGQDIGRTEVAVLSGPLDPHGVYVTAALACR